MENSQDIEEMAARTNASVREGLAVAEEKTRATAEEYRQKTADALHSGAEKARDYSRRASSDRVTRLSRRTGEELENAADYIEHHSLRQISADCAVWMKRNPGTSLAVVLFCGLIVGRALRR